MISAKGLEGAIHRNGGEEAGSGPLDAGHGLRVVLDRGDGRELACGKNSARKGGARIRKTKRMKE